MTSELPSLSSTLQKSFWVRKVSALELLSVVLSSFSCSSEISEVSFAESSCAMESRLIEDVVKAAREGGILETFCRRMDWMAGRNDVRVLTLARREVVRGRERRRVRESIVARELQALGLSQIDGIGCAYPIPAG